MEEEVRTSRYKKTDCLTWFRFTRYGSSTCGHLSRVRDSVCRLGRQGDAFQRATRFSRKQDVVVESGADGMMVMAVRAIELAATVFGIVGIVGSTNRDDRRRISCSERFASFHRSSSHGYAPSTQFPSESITDCGSSSGPDKSRVEQTLCAYCPTR
jgi:hypothetical protein